MLTTWLYIQSFRRLTADDNESADKDTSTSSMQVEAIAGGYPRVGCIIDDTWRRQGVALQLAF
jgi:hypothetical protein